jgi:acetyl esterase/lipase
MLILEYSSRILSFISLFFCLWTIIKSPPGVWGGVVWLPKLWGGAWAPFLAVLGFIGANLAWISRDYITVIAGLLAAVLGIRHTMLVTRGQDHFARVLGEKWEDRISPGLRARLVSKRYRFIQPAPPVIPGKRNVDLGKSGKTDESLVCDIWQPPQGVPPTGLAVIYFHGGLWQALDKDFLTQPLFRRLAGQGHLVMDVAYSLAPGADLARMLGDVKQSIVWLKAHSHEYAIDPDRIVLMGVSGGAHLALLAAYAPGHPLFQQVSPSVDMSVRAIISMFGITDMVTFFREYARSNPRQPEFSSQITDALRPHIFNRTWLEKLMTRTRAFPAYRYGNMPGGALLLVNLLGGTLKEIPGVYRQASPITYAGSNCPPTLLIAAGDDFVVAVSQGRGLHKALTDAGAKSIFIEFPGSVHGFDQYIGVSRRIAPAAQSVIYDIERFLALMV